MKKNLLIVSGLATLVVALSLPTLDRAQSAGGGSYNNPNFSTVTNIVTTNAVFVMSPQTGAGAGIEGDMYANSPPSPNYIGRIGMSFNSGKSPFLWFVGGNGWTNQVNFPAGIQNIGSDSGATGVNAALPGIGDPGFNRMYITFDSHPSVWGPSHSSDDQGLTIQAANTYGSGGLLQFSTMITNGNGVPVTLFQNHVALAYTSTNASIINPSLLPGWFYTIIDSTAANHTNHHGFAIAQDTFSDHSTAGNYSQLMADIASERVYFPKMTLNAFNPWDAGFSASFFDSVSGALVMNNLPLYFTTNNIATTATVDMRVGYSDISANASFAFAGVIGLSNSVYQTSVVIVTNNAARSASTISITLPANVWQQGTFNVTNGGVTALTWFASANRFTNCTALPMN